jgi:hypothetical protein
MIRTVKLYRFCPLLFYLLYCWSTNGLSNAWQTPIVFHNELFKECDRYLKRYKEKHLQRRDLLNAVPVALCNVGVATVVGLSDPISVCASPLRNEYSTPQELSVGEALRRSASNIPGYGPTDIFYPLTWQGTWTLRRENYTKINETPVTLIYPIRFIQSVDKEAVVADRTFNELNYWETVQGGDKRGGTVQTIKWTETNPNDLDIFFTNGIHRNLNITKRATERTDTTVSSSEFQRILEDKSSMNGSMVPSITSRRILTKWKMITDNQIEGIEAIYDMNMDGNVDPMNFSLTTNEQRQPKLLSKSRLYLDR